MSVQDAVVHIRPKRSLVITALVTFFVLTIPIFWVLYWDLASDPVWPAVLVVQIVVAALCLAILLRQLQVFAAVANAQLSGNGIFSRTTVVPLSQIRSVELARVYVRNSLETTLQFVALDSTAHCRFRLRGEFWHEADLRRLAAALNVGPITETQPMTTGEFFSQFPGARYWFERAR